MTVPIGNWSAIASTKSDSDAKLHQTAQQLEGVLFDRLFAAMRETVPDDGIIPSDNAQSMFTDMLDSRVASDLPKQLSGDRSLADAMYKQLRAQQHESSASQPAPPSGGKLP